MKPDFFLPVKIFLLISAIIFISACNAEQADKPNILVIVTDDLGYADLSFLPYASDDVQTPNIDRIAGDGMFFTNAYSTSPICSPSRCGLLTGQYQARWGNYWYGEGGLPDSILTLPQALKELGYHNVKIGKTHLNGGPVEHPLDHGFDEFLGFIHHTWDYLRLTQADADAYGEKNAKAAQVGPLMANHEMVDFPDDYTTDIFTSKAVEVIKDGERKGPFYIELEYNAVHHPTYVCHPDYLEHFGIEQFPFWDPEKEARNVWHRKWGHLDAIDPDGRKRYRLQLKVLDDGIGEILDALESTGQADNTIIVFLSDNGGTINTYSVNRPLNGYKYMFGEGGLRIPIIISCPGITMEQGSSDVLTSAMDIFPTLIELTGGSMPSDLDGRSLVPVLEGNTDAYGHEQLIFSNGRDSWVVRKGPWKLSHNIGWTHSSFKLVDGTCYRDSMEYIYHDGDLLFNLEDDISEQTDLALQYPEAVIELTEMYYSWRSGMSDPRTGDGILKKK